MRALIAVALTCCMNLAAASEPPTPGRGDAASSNKQQAAQEKTDPKSNKGTSNAPTTVIEVSPSTVLKVDATEKPEHRHDYSSGEWWLVYLTGALVFVTAILALYTFRLFRATVKLGAEASITSNRQETETKTALAIAQQAATASETAAKAAQEQVRVSAEQMKRSHRAWLVIKNVEHKLTMNFDARPAKLTGNVQVVNASDSIALKVSYSHTLSVVPPRQDPSRFLGNPVPENVRQGPFGGICIPHDETDMAVDLRPNLFEVGDTTTVWVYLHTWIYYIDEIGDWHKTGTLLQAFNGDKLEIAPTGIVELRFRDVGFAHHVE